MVLLAPDPTSKDKGLVVIGSLANVRRLIKDPCCEFLKQSPLLILK